MATVAGSGSRLQSAVGSALELRALLRAVVDYGIESLGCSGGSAFVLDPASGRLELWAHTYGDRHLELSLDWGEGIAGKALAERGRYVAGPPRLRAMAVRITAMQAESLRSIVALASPREDPAFVFSFDFHGVSAEPVDDEGLSVAERGRVDRLEPELSETWLANALVRSRTHEGIARIRRAAERPGRLRQEVSAFLSEFKRQIDPRDDSVLGLSLHLVDRRRRVVRTIQSQGSLTGPPAVLALDQGAIAARVARTGRPWLGVEAQAPRDRGDRPAATSALRVVVPLVPVPISHGRFAGELPSAASSAEDLFGTWIDWQPAGEGPLAPQRSGHFREAILPAPPAEIVFGLVEILTRRRVGPATALEAEELETASRHAVKAWKLARGVFEGTLAGALDTVGRSATLAGWRAVELDVAMPDWLSPERRSYPIAAPWPVATPSPLSAATSPPPEPAEIRFGQPLRGAAGRPSGDDELDRLLRDETCRAIHLALRLDDYVSTPYLLATDKNDRVIGTEVPDPELPAILQEICREAGAETSAYFEWRDAVGGDFAGIDFGYRVKGEAQGPVAPEPALGDQIEECLASGRSEFGMAHGASGPALGILPVVLIDGVKAALVLSYRRVPEPTQKAVLEGQAVRWAHRLSIRRLVVLDRFYRRMGELRSIVAIAQEAAEGESNLGRHLVAFVEELAARLRFAGLVLMLYSQAEDYGTPASEGATASRIVRRLWNCQRGEADRPPVHSGLFLDDPLELTPGHRAAAERRLVVHRPGDPLRASELEAACRTLEDRAAALHDQGKPEPALALDQIVRLARGATTTILTAPLVSGAGRELDQAALSVFLHGDHRFDRTRQRLVLELADLVAGGVTRMRELDRKSFEEKHTARLERLRSVLSGARSDEEIVGHLFAGMGGRSRRSEAWNLADDATFWVLDPEENELVARSVRGRALSALEQASGKGESLVIPPRDHPWIARYLLSKWPDRDLPSAGAFWLAQLPLESAGEPLSAAYSRLGHRWLLCFPVQHADGRVLGLVDCPRREPLLAEERLALETVLRRLSHQLASTFEIARYRRANEFARKLTQKVMERPSRLLPGPGYQDLVELVREETGTAECDLFLELEGRIYLHASTRSGGPRTPEERYRFEITPDVTERLLRLAFDPSSAERSRLRVRHGSPAPLATKGLSPPLKDLLALDHREEALALELRLEGGAADSNSGLLVLTGPPSRQWNGRTIKRSGILTRLDRRLALDLSVVVQRLVATSQLVEHQLLVIDELQHALGQPLQIIRSAGEAAIRELRKLSGGPIADPLLDDLREGVRLLEEGRNHVAAFARMGRSAPTPTAEVDLAELVTQCCRLKTGDATRNGVTIRPPAASSGIRVRGDASWLRQAMLNLLQNAVKYSWAAKEVRVDLQAFSDRIELKVENFGIGIPEENLRRIFDPYFRSRFGDLKGVRPGAGIGLAVVRHAIEVIHGGKVEALSGPLLADPTLAAGTANVPHLTTLIVRLPRRQGAPAARRLPPTGGRR